MSPLADYFDRMSALRTMDRDFERLLSGEATGSEELAQLEAFVAAFATGGEPPNDSSHMATALAATTRSSAPRPLRSVFRRLVVLSASFAIVLAFSGVAMAADGAAPGDLLYSVDRALESIGIGDGGIDERIVEFEDLRDRDRLEEAIEFLEKEMQTASPTEAATAGEHLAAATGAEETGGEPSAPQTVASEYDDPNTSTDAAPDSGSRDDASTQSPPNTDTAADQPSDNNGLSVGQGDNSPPGQVKENENRAEPEKAGPKESPGTGPPDESPSPSSNQGSNDPGSTGNQADPDNNGNTDPGTPQGNALGQDEDQGQGKGQDKGQGQGKGQEPDQG